MNKYTQLKKQLYDIYNPININKNKTTKNLNTMLKVISGNKKIFVEYSIKN